MHLHLRLEGLGAKHDVIVTFITGVLSRTRRRSASSNNSQDGGSTTTLKSMKTRLTRHDLQYLNVNQYCHILPFFFLF